MSLMAVMRLVGTLAVLGLCLLGYRAEAEALYAPAPRPPLGDEAVLLGESGTDVSRFPGFPELLLRKMAIDRFWRGDRDKTTHVVTQERVVSMPGSRVNDRQIVDDAALPSEAQRNPQLKEVVLG